MAGEENIELQWPQRTFMELQDGKNLLDIRAWDEVAPYMREGDIAVATFMKSGTTWMLQLILQMLHNGEETLSAPDHTINHAALWIENKLIPPTDAVAKFKAATTERRLLKSHLQLDALLFSPKLRYVCVVRDGRDVVLSQYNHFVSMPAEFFRRRSGKDVSILTHFDTFFENWLLHGNRPLSPDYFHHVLSWWKFRSCDNILLVNYSEMHNNLAEIALRVADFLGVPVHVDSEGFRQILHHASFGYMKEHEELFEFPADVLRPGSFIHRGVTGRWREVLSEAQCRMYWEKVTECWPPELVEFVHKDSY